MIGHVRIVSVTVGIVVSFNDSLSGRFQGVFYDIIFSIIVGGHKSFDESFQI